MGPTDASQEPFRFQEFWQYSHPTHNRYAVMVQGPYLDVVLPFDDFARFELARFRSGEWIALKDKRGQSIPLAVFVDRGHVFGAWLP
jgi:hypothetical protein